MTTIKQNNHQFFCTLPSEIIFQIMQNIGINYITMIPAISKTFYKQKRKMYSEYFKSDCFLLNHMQNKNVNIIRMLSESSISFQQFDLMYENIRNGDFRKTPSQNIRLTKDNIKQYQINNTFQVFQLLKLSIYTYNTTKDFQYWEDCCKMILTTMENYFKDLFFARNRNKVFISFIDSSNDFIWEHSNINLYNICENLNLIYFDNNFDDRFKNNLESFDEIIIKNNGKQIITTASLIKCFFKTNILFEKSKFDIFLNYVFFHYLNYIFKSGLYNEILENEEFLQETQVIYKEFHEDLNDIADDVITPYFKQMISKKLKEYKLS